MQQYTTKSTVTARPMTRYVYNQYRGWTVPENENGSDPGYLVDYGGGKYVHPGHVGHINWVPKEQFEATCVVDTPNHFAQKVVAFNAMYRMPVGTKPTVLGSQRLRDLKKILSDELNEIDDLIVQAEAMEQSPTGGTGGMELLVGMADLMGDIQVYCASEMVKWGLPIDSTLAIIMESNFSKMGADGKPIYDDTGKLLKGPNYWKPEPMIMGKLQACRSDGTQQ